MAALPTLKDPTIQNLKSKIQNFRGRDGYEEKNLGG